tara:strand:+ start:632 stop:1024 length:393 start_codon:yes stop_codon:yes gene_type:complete
MDEAMDEAMEVAEEAAELAALETDEAADVAAEEAADDPPEDPPAATRAQIWEVMLWVSEKKEMSIKFWRSGDHLVALTQCLLRRAAGDNTRSGLAGDGSVGITALACVIVNTAARVANGGGQAGLSASWD